LENLEDRDDLTINDLITELYLSWGNNGFSKSFSSPEQKNVIIAWAYDCNVANGGHVSFFDRFGDVFSTDEVAEALHATGGEKCALNFLSAAERICYDEQSGYGFGDDEPEDTEDNILWDMKPAFADLVEEYASNKKDLIFK